MLLFVSVWTVSEPIKVLVDYSTSKDASDWMLVMSFRISAPLDRKDGIIV